MKKARYRMMRRIIESPSYYGNRMETMDSKCAYYLDSGTKASNKIIREAFFKTAAMYSKRHQYYFKKISGYDLRKSV